MFRLNPGLPWTGQSPANLCPQLSTMPTEHKLILHTLNWGMNLLTSCCQLCSVEAGATTRKGPQMLCVYKNETPYGWLHALVTFQRQFPEIKDFVHSGPIFLFSDKAFKETWTSQKVIDFPPTSEINGTDSSLWYCNYNGFTNSSLSWSLS